MEGCAPSRPILRRRRIDEFWERSPRRPDFGDSPKRTSVVTFGGAHASSVLVSLSCRNELPFLPARVFTLGPLSVNSMQPQTDPDGPLRRARNGSENNYLDVCGLGAGQKIILLACARSERVTERFSNHKLVRIPLENLFLALNEPVFSQIIIF